jgi:hypothetical protein
MLATIPVGYNRDLDDALTGGALGGTVKLPHASQMAEVGAGGARASESDVRVALARRERGRDCEVERPS